MHAYQFEDWKKPHVSLATQYNSWQCFPGTEYLVNMAIDVTYPAGTEMQELKSHEFWKNRIFLKCHVDSKSLPQIVRQTNIIEKGP